MHNRKKVRETKIIQERLDQIRDEECVYNIVVNTQKNCLRYTGKINDKKIDISVSLNKDTREVAMEKMMNKIEALKQSALTNEPGFNYYPQQPNYQEYCKKIKLTIN